MTDTALQQAAEWIAEAPHILVTAGAGLSAAAGFDYGDTKRFAELFPAFAKQGFSARYQAIGYAGWTPAQKWGYWSVHVADIRFGPRRDPVYRDVLSLVSHTDHFVLTSNVDQLFARNGFAPHRILTPQGDYGLLQCHRGCGEHTWDSEPAINRMLATLDPVTQTVTDQDAIPLCPTCGGQTFLNVRLDRFFVERPYDRQRERIRQWLGEVGPEPVLVLEIGAGFNTPGVVRWPGERLAAAHPESRLIRINMDHPETPVELAGRSLGFDAEAAGVVAQLARQVSGA